jgi:tripartite-type tricarboxylate transporter receptor subunit TctC
MKRLFVCCLILALAGTGSVFASDVQKGKFPSKPITVIVPYAPGGSSDLIARVVAKVSPKYFSGQAMVIVNKPGGSSNIGLMELVNRTQWGKRPCFPLCGRIRGVAIEMDG